MPEGWLWAARPLRCGDLRRAGGGDALGEAHHRLAAGVDPDEERQDQVEQRGHREQQLKMAVQVGDGEQQPGDERRRRAAGSTQPR